MSQFFLSMEDELMRRFGSENLKGMMDRLGIEEDEPIESKMVSRAVESAQKRVEGNNFDSRKTILSYDDVLREQREIIYEQRMQIIESESNVREIVEGMIETTIARTVDTNTAEEEVENWNLQAIIRSEERRVGKECRDRGSMEESNKKKEDRECTGE